MVPAAADENGPPLTAPQRCCAVAGHDASTCATLDQPKEVESVKSTSKTTVRKVSSNTFRVSSVSTRSAATGKFIRKADTPNRFIARSSPEVQAKLTQSTALPH